MESENAVQSYDVVVIGGGVTGLSTAIHLRELGIPKVLLIERHFVGAGQSGRAAGIVRSLVANVTVASMLRTSIKFFTTFQERYGPKLNINSIGYLLVNELSAREELESVIRSAAEAGTQASFVGVDEALLLQPGLRATSDDIFVFEPDAIYVDPMVAVNALSIVAKQLGIEIREGTQVAQIKVRSNAVIGVDIGQEIVSSRNVLVATASWGAPLLRGLNVHLPVHTHRVEMAFYSTPTASPLRLKRIISDARTTLYMRPEGQDQMFVGWREGDRIHGTKDLREVDPDNYWQTSRYNSLLDMSSRLRRTLPFMKDGFVHRTYACVYDYTPDAMPVLDGVEEVKGLYFALGFSGGGFSLSPWVGQAMAQFIASREKSSDLALLSAARFLENRPVRWSNVIKQETTPTLPGTDDN